MRLKKRAVSPIVATSLFIIFAIAIGAVLMQWGNFYIEQLPETEDASPLLCDPLGVLKLKLVNNEINDTEYLRLKGLLVEG